eukprot:TRINITY_DN2670_c0_g1_i1.p1 TRINITY_DN2670_c0_g1~~TRINITY_DN2670_c0_g1_i1.p1  ORF type:complete len:134 (-),score=26.32 TRINITY_DN2670_c0_g1_i1:465-866(-)
MDLNKLIGYNRGGAHTVDMEGVIHAMPTFDKSNLRSPSSELQRDSEKPSLNNAPANEKDRPSSSRSFWSTVMDVPPSSSPSSSLSAPNSRVAVSPVSLRLHDTPVCTPSNTNLSINTEQQLAHRDRDGSEGKP